MSLQQFLRLTTRLPNTFNRHIFKSCKRRTHDFANDPTPNTDSVWGEYVHRKMNFVQTRNWTIAAWATGTAFWYWVMWHFYYQLDHVTGHWEYPDPKQWTDEELGIPSDLDDIAVIPPQMDIAVGQK